MPRSATARTARAFSQTYAIRQDRKGQRTDADLNAAICRDTRTPAQREQAIAAGRALKAKLAALKQEA